MFSVAFGTIFNWDKLDIHGSAGHTEPWPGASEEWFHVEENRECPRESLWVTESQPLEPDTAESCAQLRWGQTLNG